MKPHNPAQAIIYIYTRHTPVFFHASSHPARRAYAPTVHSSDKPAAVYVCTYTHTYTQARV